MNLKQSIPLALLAGFILFEVITGIVDAYEDRLKLAKREACKTGFKRAFVRYNAMDKLSDEQRINRAKTDADYVCKDWVLEYL